MEIKIPEVPECINEPIKEGLTPVTSAVGQSVSETFTSLWQIILGGINFKAKEMQYKRQKNLEKFKKEFDEKFEKIPLENRVEGEVHSIGPILEASKYYIDEEKIRNMFSSLLASSLNNKVKDLVHPSFVEIVKQLSSYDAEVIEAISSVEEPNIPVAQYFYYCNGSMQIIVDKVAILPKITKNVDSDYCVKISSSLDNLQRLGILDINMEAHVNGVDYNIFKNTEIYEHPNCEVHFEGLDYENSRVQIGYKGGIIRLTEFGKQFVKVCI